MVKFKEAKIWDCACYNWLSLTQVVVFVNNYDYYNHYGNIMGDKLLVNFGTKLQC